MTNGLLDPWIVAFVFTPLLISAGSVGALLIRHAAGVGQRRPVLGLLAVMLPPLALPFIYAAAAIIEATGAPPAAIIRALVIATMAGLVAGVPLGLGSRWRHESMPQLTAWGIASSVGTSAYFLVAMRWLAGGD